MPSPRSGTVTTDIASGVREFKAGKIEFRNDKGGNVAAAVGKLSFDNQTVNYALDGRRLKKGVDFGLDRDQPSATLQVGDAFSERAVSHERRPPG